MANKKFLVAFQKGQEILMTTVDQVLERYGFVWKTNPYRIEDKNGTVIQSGPHFDIRESRLKYQKEALISRNESKFRVSQYPSKN